MIEREILAMRKNAAEANTSQVGSDPVYINGQRIQFTHTPIFQSKLFAMLPDDFVKMPEAAAKIKYPMENRPSEIWTNLDGTVNFAFNWVGESINEAEIPKNSRELLAVYQKLFSNFTYYESRTEHYQDNANRLRLLSWFDFLSPTLTVPVYNVIGLVSSAGRAMQCLFNSPEDVRAEWRPLVLQVFSSIQESGESA